jgi:chorismate mutase
MTGIRAVRGAIQVDRDDPGVIVADAGELLAEIVRRNGFADEDLVSVLFTMTQDLASAFPAAASRGLGYGDLPVICAAEVAVPGSLPRVIRLLAHVETGKPRSAVEHVYLRGAVVLRPDLTGHPGAPVVPDPRPAGERTTGRW